LQSFLICLAGSSYRVHVLVPDGHQGWGLEFIPMEKSHKNQGLWRVNVPFMNELMAITRTYLPLLFTLSMMMMGADAVSCISSFGQE